MNGLAGRTLLGCKRVATDFLNACGRPPTLLFLWKSVPMENIPNDLAVPQNPLSCIQAHQALPSKVTSTDPFFQRTSSLPNGVTSRVDPGGPSGPPGSSSGDAAALQPDTSLDPDEINVGSISGFDFDSERDSRMELNQIFRHSFWRVRRLATLSAFSFLALAQSRVDRFTQCGTVSWVLRSKCDPDVFRLASNGCRDRWCEACSSEKRRTIIRNVRDKLEGMNLRFLTLTLKSRDDTLTDQLNRLYKCFRMFRNRSKIKPKMTGGLYFVELTINEETGLWHPHLHILFVGDYLPHATCRAEWLSCTGDSFIVDIAGVRGAGHAASYIAKYAGKAVPRSVWNNPDRFHEAILAFKGRRLFSYFGTFKGLELSKNPADDVGWDTVAPLFTIILLARRGERFAREIMYFLSGGDTYESADLLDSS